MSKKNGSHSDPLAEALTPLLAYYDQISSEVSELESQLESKKGEQKRLKKHLQMEGLVEPTVTVRKAPQKKTHYISDGMLDRIRECITDELGGDEFTISELVQASDISEPTIRNGVKHLRDSGEIRLTSTGGTGGAHSYAWID